MRLVKLTWTKKGYQPDRYHWHNYVQSTNVNALRHDFYHHQFDETGSEAEELRALGGRYWFDNCDGLIIDNLRFLYAKTLKKKAKRSTYSYTNVEHIFTDLSAASEVENPWYYAKLLTEGWKYAQRYNIDAYKRFLDIDFEEAHSSYENLVIDLDRGIVTEKILI